MKKQLRLLISLITVVSLMLTPFNLFAEGEDGQINIIEVYYGEGKPGTEIQFVDKDLVKIEKKLKDVQYGVISEVYSHSTYTMGNQQLRNYSVGPLTDQKFIISVAKGEVKTLTNTIEVSGSVTYSGTVGAEVKKLINIEFTGSATGSITGTFEAGETYSGPDESSPYNSRQYYGAIDYDLYNVEVTKCDVYKVYNGSLFTGYEYYYSTEYVNDVKRPKAIRYSRDFYY